MLICVTHRLLCPDDFLQRLDRIAAQHPYAIVLREKDLSEHDYEALARECLRICEKHHVPLNLNSHIAVARRIGCDGIHLPFHLLMQHKQDLADFSRVGVSLHSPEEAAQLADTPATYVQAGHVFPTDCKAGIPPRGLSFLRAVCQATDLPVFGIGGINAERYPAVLQTGAAGACIMSGLMTCNDVAQTMQPMV
ncbi:thiamine phosphate synthase [Butyricicoccus sp.]|uniref:thiamine phosphate synthase n=1 Tax=Butyricicoccus sp. TaxID=2049021 RepID=UPI003D7DB7B4